MNEEILILVDEHDQEIGQMGKLEVHQRGLLHRAFSVLIFNDQGQLMIHQRAASKYHSGSLWTNTCCGHPRVGEPIQAAAERRLQEEMGLKSHLHEVYSFIYKASLENELYEHEFDHVFIGHASELPTPNQSEVEDWCYVSLDQLNDDMQQHPDRYTVWFKHIMSEQDTITQFLNYQSV